jgi:hypothetical protein
MIASMEIPHRIAQLIGGCRANPWLAANVGQGVLADETSAMKPAT